MKEDENEKFTARFIIEISNKYKKTRMFGKLEFFLKSIAIASYFSKI